MPNTDTIAAVATAVAPGQGGIAVIRLSGPSAEVTGRSVVHCPGRQEWETHRLVYGHVIDGEGRRLDEVLLLLMRGPRSFTGEDVVEIHCHGGVIAVQRVLEQVLRQPGVRRAQPGEFSQRAVLNGRLDLTRAEAVSELVAARSRRAAELAMAGLDGGIQAQITALRERLLPRCDVLTPNLLEAEALLGERPVDISKFRTDARRRCFLDARRGEGGAVPTFPRRASRRPRRSTRPRAAT